MTSRQKYTGPYRILPQHELSFDELVVDLFAGGGGASTGIERAIGRHVDIAVNHDIDAVRMHEANHPKTRHYCESVWDVDPREVCAGRPVGLLHASPDCKHFSKAKGGKPREKKIRGLAWSVLRWAATVKPRIITLENVEEFKTWGPLLEDGRPCPRRKGNTFRSFVRALERHGYRVEWREERACDFGVPTIRKRLYLVARCDGLPITWPSPTHGDPAKEAARTGRLKPWRTAAECIDWSIPCPSIFGRKKPLADATLLRIARGIERFVIKNPQPFIIKVNHGYDQFRGQELADPLDTITSKNGFALVVPVLTPRYGERHGQSPRARTVESPMATVVPTQNGAQLVSAFLAKHFGGNYTGPGAALEQPAPTVTTVDHNALVTAFIKRDFGESVGSDMGSPLPTVTAGGGGHAAEVRAFLIKYYGEGGQWQALDEPMHTIPTKDRLGLVMVHGEPYQIVDIGMRMLTPRELFRAQGFPDDYVIDHDGQGKTFTKAAQVARCGNSVCPGVMEAIIRANWNAASTAKQAA